MAFFIIVYLVSFGFTRYSNDYDPNMPYAQRWKELRSDLFGAIFLILPLTLAVTELQWIGTINSWSDKESIILVLGFLGSITVFWVLQFWSENATLPLRIAGTRAVMAGSICFFVLIPIYLQSIVSFGPMFSGLFNMVYYMAAVLGFIVSTFLVNQYRFVVCLHCSLAQSPLLIDDSVWYVS